MDIILSPFFILSFALCFSYPISYPFMLSGKLYSISVQKKPKKRTNLLERKKHWEMPVRLQMPE